DGTPVRTVYLQKSGIGTLTITLYGSAVQSVDQSMDRQWSMWFHTWSNSLILLLCLALLIYDHHIRSVNGPTVGRPYP
ncbi:hypothetical protein MTR67_012865, partial [Solanum verrucosum]